MNTIIPEPLVGIIEEVNVAVMYDENILDYQFENTNANSGESTIKIDFSRSQINLFSKILNSFFPDHIELPINDNQIHPDIDFYMQTKLEAFELLSPTESRNDKYAVWLKYKIDLYDNKKIILSKWNITGYGEHETGSRAVDSLTNAVDLALRDAGVNLAIKIEDNFDSLIKITSTEL